MLSENAQIKAHIKGFTLIEVLLAIAIFAVISLASMNIFDGVLQSEKMSKDKMQRLNDIQRALLIIERDFLQITRRSVRFEGEPPSKDFIYASDGGFSSNEQAIAFVRAGWINPGLLIPRSDVQSVAYRIEDKTLERLHFNFVDAVVGEEPKVRQLISNVSSFKLAYYYQKKWQDELIKSQLPQAIHLTIDTEDFGVIERKFLVAEPAQASSTRTGNQNQGQGDGNNSEQNGADQNSSDQNNAREVDDQR